MSIWSSALTFSTALGDFRAPLSYCDIHPSSSTPREGFLDIAYIPADGGRVRPFLRLHVEDCDAATTVVLDTAHVDALIGTLAELRARFTKETS